MLGAAQKFAELAGRKRRPQAQNTQPIFWPAAQGGINAMAAASLMPMTDCMRLINMVPGEFGVAVRKGYAEWCVKVPLGDGIKTLVPFSEAKSASPADKLFAVTNDGIYNVSTQGGTPSKVLDFPVKSNEAGWCSWHHYTTNAGQFIVLCDEANGYYLYTASTNTWGAGSITPDTGVTETITPDKLAFVMVWKARLWFVERNTGRAWYFSTPGVIAGAAKPFYFGNKFKYGGYLKSLWNWTLDGGEGVDDYLVAVSSAGDLMIYKGTDPSSPSTFALHGSWYIGNVCQGRRQADDMGGDLLLLSSYGVLQASKLISGMPLTDLQASISYKINPRVNTLMQRLSTTYGWELVSCPSEQLLFLITPKEVGVPSTQFAWHTATHAWAMFFGLPMKTASMWQSKLYFGADDNRVYVHDGFVDQAMLNPADGTLQPIDWECLTSYQGFNAPARFKRVQFVRPQFVGDADPTYEIRIKYDFNVLPPGGLPAFLGGAGSVWNVGLWDSAIWGGGYVVSQSLKGGSGLGRYIALYLRGRSASQLTHVGTDVLLDSGGLL